MCIAIYININFNPNIAWLHRVCTTRWSAPDSIVLAVTSYSLVHEIHFSICNPSLWHQEVEKDFSHRRTHFNQSGYSDCSNIYYLELKVLSVWLSSCPLYTKCYLHFLFLGVADHRNVVFGDLYYSFDVLATSNGKLITVANS